MKELERLSDEELLNEYVPWCQSPCFTEQERDEKVRLMTAVVNELARRYKDASGALDELAHFCDMEADIVTIGLESFGGSPITAKRLSRLHAQIARRKQT